MLTQLSEMIRVHCQLVAISKCKKRILSLRVYGAVYNLIQEPGASFSVVPLRIHSGNLHRRAQCWATPAPAVIYPVNELRSPAEEIQTLVLSEISNQDMELH